MLSPRNSCPSSSRSYIQTFSKIDGVKLLSSFRLSTIRLRGKVELKKVFLKFHIRYKKSDTQSKLRNPVFLNTQLPGTLGPSQDIRTNNFKFLVSDVLRIHLRLSKSWVQQNRTNTTWERDQTSGKGLLVCPSLVLNFLSLCNDLIDTGGRGVWEEWTTEGSSGQRGLFQHEEGLHLQFLFYDVPVVFYQGCILPSWSHLNKIQTCRLVERSGTLSREVQFSLRSYFFNRHRSFTEVKGQFILSEHS